MRSQIFNGSVFHKRFMPREHEFTYGSYFMKISLNELDEIKNKVFSINQFNIFSFNFEDHGHRDGSDLRNFALELLQKHNCQDQKIDDIVIHTMPRVLGFVFNPVSFWYLYQAEKIVYVIAEVNNTFGETHSYLLTPQNLTENKLMQVSPFNQIIGKYDFSFLSTPKFDKVTINYKVKDQQLVIAQITGAPSEWSTKVLLKTFLKNPFVNYLIVFLIHWQALRLFLKGITFYGKNGAIE